MITIVKDRENTIQSIRKRLDLLNDMYDTFQRDFEEGHEAEWKELRDIIKTQIIMLINKL